MTFTSEPYVPIEKPCPICTKVFEGMADVPDELCDECVDRNMALYLSGFKDGLEQGRSEDKP